MEKRFPRLMKSYKDKGKNWRKECVDYADHKASYNHSLVRKSVIHKKINYDLVNGIIHMEDFEKLLNPNLQDLDILKVEKLQHYPIMNSKLNVLRGEESKRVFDYRVVVTNPTAVSEIELSKKDECLLRLLAIVEDSSLNEDLYNAEMEKLQYYMNFEYQDIREQRSNFLIKHYSDELDMPTMFNLGFMDGMTVGEELYLCDIIGGEPTIRRLNPMKVRIIKGGYSDRIEDADMIIIEDYWNPGRVIDSYYDVLTKKDIKCLEEGPQDPASASVDDMDNIDGTAGFINANMLDDVFEHSFYFDPASYFGETVETNLSPYDTLGNVRVLQVYWKSKRMIKRIKSYDPETGEEVYTFRTEDYVPNKDRGEEESIFWVNEAWEGTKIGKNIYVNMRPRVVQYNRLSNPSRCHFGIVGGIYNLNEDKPFSLVDMMKPYAYLYDVIHDRLVDAIGNNWGAIMDLDLALIPDGWTPEKWMYFAKVNHIRIRNSFKEGNKGAATGKLAGAMNSNSLMGISLDLGNYIQQLINFLEWIKTTLGEIAGISKQREGLISNRETVGGVERATLLSSHITEWLFNKHDNIKRRAIECFIETAKAAMKGKKNFKFPYILPDGSLIICEIDGDEFAENDYGLVVSNDNKVQDLNSKLDALAQAALQNSTLSFGAIMKLYGTASLAEKLRFIEADERRILEQNQLAQEMEMQQLQQAILMQLQQKQAELEAKDMMNLRDNETKILVAEIQALSQLIDSDSETDGIIEPMSDKDRAELNEKIRLFDAKLKLDLLKHQLEKERLTFDKNKAKKDLELKAKQIAKLRVSPR